MINNSTLNFNIAKQSFKSKFRSNQVSFGMREKHSPNLFAAKPVLEEETKANKLVSDFYNFHGRDDKNIFQSVFGTANREKLN